MLNAFAGAETDVTPVGFHAWGLYKFQLAGVIDGYGGEDIAWGIGGGALADIEANFYETLKPDFFHLSEGPCVYPKHKMLQKEYAPLMEELRLLESKNAIDAFVAECYPGPEEYIASGRFDHVGILSRRYGEDAFIALHNATPVNDVFDSEGFMGGFDEAMIAAAEKPDMMAYLVYRSHMKSLDYCRALAACGAHAHISTEAYLSSDLVSPKLYERILFDAQKDFYRGVADAGLIPVMCFWGNINPLLPYFRKIPFKGIMIEEPRKGYDLNAACIKRELSETGAAVFGNLPAETLLLDGTPEEVGLATRAMLDSLGDTKGFVMCCGTPIAFDTPLENLTAMADAARRYARGAKP